MFVLFQKIIYILGLSYFMLNLLIFYAHFIHPKSSNYIKNVIVNNLTECNKINQFVKQSKDFVYFIADPYFYLISLKNQFELFINHSPNILLLLIKIYNYFDLS